MSTTSIAAMLVAMTMTVSRVTRFPTTPGRESAFKSSMPFAFVANATSSKVIPGARDTN
jgi:hypothetical protein